MAEELAKTLADAMSALPKELIIFVVSMLPLIELRGGLILAPILDIPMLKAIPICLAGNILPIPFILWFITPIFAWLKKTKLFRPLVEKLETKSMLFVGIPLPGTGAWTGALIASLLNIKLKKAFPAILLGLLLATAIMCTITYFIPWAVKNWF